MHKIDLYLLHSLIGTSEAPYTRIQRFKADFSARDLHDSETVELLAERMFVDDLTNLRALIHACLQECLDCAIKNE